MSKETAPEAAARIRKEIGDEDLIICVLGGTKFQGAQSEALVQIVAKHLCDTMGSQAKFLTGGMAGVQETFAKNCGDGSRVWNLLPVGEKSNYGVGTDLEAGENLEERKAIFGQIGDLYITVEGGPGVAEEARAAYARGAGILPLSRTGGASTGMFNFPAEALLPPSWVTNQEFWTQLGDEAIPVEMTAGAVAQLAKIYYVSNKKQSSIWEILDELIGIDRSSLVKALAVVLGILFIASMWFVYSEIKRGRLLLALLHIGFIVLLLALVLSIAFVMAETSRLETEKKQLDDSKETSKSDKKTD